MRSSLLLLAALTGEPVRFTGRYNDIPGVALNVTPVQPRLPVHVAIQRREFLDRTFLVEGAERPNWKLTDDVSEFLGYMCNRAVATIDTTLVEAWFTPEIPVPAGPDDYYGLPGLILVVTTDNGNRSYVATEVSLRPVSAESIAAPTEGRKVTQEEFDKIVAEKRKEMRAQRGNNREIMIRRND